MLYVSVGFPAAEELACQDTCTVRWQKVGAEPSAAPSAITNVIRFIFLTFLARTERAPLRRANFALTSRLVAQEKSQAKKSCGLCRGVLRRLERSNEGDVGISKCDRSARAEADRCPGNRCEDAELFDDEFLKFARRRLRQLGFENQMAFMHF